MKYFRIFLTLLASFCFFFTYVCKLNLSLTINKMVRVAPLESTQPLVMKTNFDVRDNSPEPFIYTIEHTYSNLWRPNPVKKETFLVRKDIVNKTSVANQTTGSFSQAEPTNLEEAETQEPFLLNWSEAEKNDLLTAFFYGYILVQVPAGRMAETLGPKSIFLMVGLGSSLCSILFPFAAKYSSNMTLVFIDRFLLGASQSAMFPAVYVFLCQWLPKSERPKWFPFPSAFSRFGTIAMNLVVPIILSNYSWEAVFYVSGGATFVWSVLFMIFATSEPRDNFWISKEEVLYIESHMEPRVGTLTQPSITASGFTINESALKEPKKPSLNWFKMFTNKAVLIMSLVMFTAEWSNAILLIKLPQYLDNVFKMDTAEIGFWSSVMLVIFCLMYPIAGLIATKLDNSDIDWFTPIRVRKIFELLANILQATGCIVIAFYSDKTVVVASLILMMIGRSIVGGGQCLMPPEISKEYSGTVFAYSNTIANIAGIVAPRTVTWMVKDPYEHQSWFWFYILSACIFMFGGLIFCLFAQNRPHNFSKKPKLQKNAAISQAKLHYIDLEPEEVYRMRAFSQITSEPNPKKISSFQK